MTHNQTAFEAFKSYYIISKRLIRHKIAWMSRGFDGTDNVSISWTAPGEGCSEPNLILFGSVTVTITTQQTVTWFLQILFTGDIWIFSRRVSMGVEPKPGIEDEVELWSVKESYELFSGLRRDLEGNLDELLEQTPSGF